MGFEGFPIAMVFLRSAMWVSLGIALGRVAGFLRDAGLAAKFGVQGPADVAVVLLLVPDSLLNILVGGAMSAALIPEFARYGKGVRARALLVQSTLLSGGGALALVLGMWVFAGAVLRLLAPGFSEPTRALALPLFRAALWAIPLTFLTGVTTAYLQSNHRFLVPALGTLLFNTVLIAAIYGSGGGGAALSALAVAVIAACFVRLASQAGAIGRVSVSFRFFRWRLFHRDLVTRYLQAVAAGSFVALMPVLARSAASLTAEGGMALFNYAAKLVELPLGVAVTVLSVAVFPVLSHAFARGVETGPILRSSFRWVFSISVAVMLSLFLFRGLFAELAFGWGRMTADNLASLAALLGIGLWSLPFHGVSSLLMAVFNAKRDTGTPLRVNALGAALFFPLAFLFSAGGGGVRGVMAAQTFVVLAVCGAQAWALFRRHEIALWDYLSPGPVGTFLVLSMGIGGAVSLIRDHWVLTPGPSVALALGTGAALLVAGLWSLGGRSALSLPRRAHGA